jgi:hypothetical protein
MAFKRIANFRGKNTLKALFKRALTGLHYVEASFDITLSKQESPETQTLALHT